MKNDKTTTTLIFDIEANGLRDSVTTVHCIATLNVDTLETQAYYGPTLLDGVRALETADRLVAHNGITYDLPVLRQLLGAMLPDSKLVDTLVLSRLGMPTRPGGHSLANWGSIVGHAKVEHDEWEHFSPAMLVRCQEDVLLNHKVWLRLSPMLEAMPLAVEIETKTASVISRMVDRGIHLDVPATHELLSTLLDEQAELLVQADAILPTVYKAKGVAKALKNDANKAHWGHGSLCGGAEFQEVTQVKLSATSRADVALYFTSVHGWVPSALTPTGQPKIDDEVLRGMPYEEAAVFAELYKVNKLVGYINAEPQKNGRGGGWLQHVTSAGKLHANFIPLTAITGRPSCTSPNLQQVSTDKRARALFVPRDGWVMVGVDADGQELRCLGHYLAPFDEGTYGNEVVHGDIHTKIQNVIGFNSRKHTKPVEYALIYGGGDEKLGQLSAKDALAAGKKLRRGLRAEGKRIRKSIMDGVPGFSDLLNAVKAKATTEGKLRGLDGRTLWVRSAHSALNLVLQSAGIILMKLTIAMLDDAFAEAGLVEDVDYGLVLWVHDELQFECKPEVAEQVGDIVKGCMAKASTRLGFRVSMTGSHAIGSDWSQTH